tara:strand:+ start:7461 stop:8912 length:1452 start_codon:yes stop_codon:yes gene_type:complete
VTFIGNQVPLEWIGLARVKDTYPRLWLPPIPLLGWAYKDGSPDSIVVRRNVNDIEWDSDSGLPVRIPWSVLALFVVPAGGDRSASKARQQLGFPPACIFSSSTSGRCQAKSLHVVGPQTTLQTIDNHTCCTECIRKIELGCRGNTVPATRLHVHRMAHLAPAVREAIQWLLLMPYTIYTAVQAISPSSMHNHYSSPDACISAILDVWKTAKIRPFDSLIKCILTEQTPLHIWTTHLFPHSSSQEWTGKVAESLRTTGWFPLNETTAVYKKDRKKRVRVSVIGDLVAWEDIADACEKVVDNNILVLRESWDAARAIPWHLVTAYKKNAPDLRHCGDSFIQRFVTDGMQYCLDQTTCLILDNAHTLTYPKLSAICTAHPDVPIRLVGDPLMWNTAIGGSPYFDMQQQPAPTPHLIHTHNKKHAKDPPMYVSATWKCYPHEFGSCLVQNRFLIVISSTKGHADSLHARVASKDSLFSFIKEIDCSP